MQESNPKQPTLTFGREKDKSLDDVAVELGDEDEKSCEQFLDNNGLDGKGSTIYFDNISYEVRVRDTESRKCCSCAKISKNILKNVSGIFRPGLNAILGPTGSGKTTLLDVVAGRRNDAGSRLSGQVLLDGNPLPPNFRYISGYVMQDDMVMDMLTVRENVMFSAALRLPVSTSKQHHQLVAQILSDLGLDNCADTRVGTVFVRGISGGERKRTNIAMELVASPKVLFLDEPTSGLDANTAYSVMDVLHSLSRRGMTVILSIHQPRYAIYKLFDTLTLLSRGELVYIGSTSAALDHFSSAGYVCEQHNCPSDFFLDVISGAVRSYAADKIISEKHTGNGFVKDECNKILLVNGKNTESSEDHHSSLVSHYASSELCKNVLSEIEDIKSSVGNDVDVVKAYQNVSYQTSFCRQFAVLARRTWLSVIRNSHALLSQIFSAIILGMIVGSIYFRTGDSAPREAFQNRVGAFFFIVMNYVFSNMTAVDIFIKERSLFIHETISGYYRVSAYFLSKIICDVIPQRLFPITMFAVVSYFLIGFRLSCVHFLLYLLNMSLTSLSGTSVALLFGAMCSQHSIGTLFTALVWTCMMVYSGILVMVDTIPAWLQWIKWLSIFRYSMNAFQINEFKDLYVCDPTNVNVTSTAHHHTLKYNCSGNEYLEDQGIRYEAGIIDLLYNEVALFVILLTLLLFTYIQLRRTKPFH